MWTSTVSSNLLDAVRLTRDTASAGR